MSIRNLDALFHPKAIALLGASNEAGSVGAVIMRNLLAGGFRGQIMPVNPHETSIQGRENHRSVSELPVTPDLAIIATPPAAIPALVAELGARGCRAAIVITSGLDRDQRAQMFEAARPHLMRIVGPNCLGFLSPRAGLNASFAHLKPLAGDVAFVTQSGAIATSILDWATGRGIGFSHIVSLGDMSDVDFGDLLDYLALDAQTKSILLYVETITHARKFMSAARIAARAKPTIVVKAGRGEGGARAAASHTGAMAGADSVYDAAFRRAGMLRVEGLRDLFDAAETLAHGVKPHGDRLTILTNGGGLGVIAADALEQQHGRLASLSDSCAAALDKVLPRAWSRANPIDILGDARGARYGASLDALADEHDQQDAILLMNCPTGVTDNLEAAEAVLAARVRHPRLPLIACWMGETTAAAPRKRLSDAHVPNYETPEEAVRAFLHLADYARNQASLMETPEASAERPAASREAARDIIANVLAEDRTLLSAPEARRVVAAYGVPAVETETVVSPEDAGAVATRIKGPFALKILSRDITHKTDVGGVALDLVDAEAVVAAARRMLDAVHRSAPGAHIDGFTLEPMIKRPMAHELIIGASEDRTFGPALLFGHGGVAAETVADRVMGLPPLNSALALEMIARTRVAKLLAGYRDRPAADHAAIARALVSVSDLIVDIPEIVELDINPLLADAEGVLALDARIVVRAISGDRMERLCIRPYPAELAKDILLDNNVELRLRPIRPDDAPALIEMGARTSRQDLRLRFHGAVRGITSLASARLTQIDYDREMAFVAVEAKGDIAGVASLGFDPEFETAEFAIVVRSDMQGHGLGRKLIAEILIHARARGAERVWGDVLRENENMLTMAREMGAALTPRSDGPAIVRAEFHLTP
jgi:acetyltransferase